MRIVLTALVLFCLTGTESVFACGIATTLLNPTLEQYRKWLDTFDGVVFVGRVLRFANPENRPVRTLLFEPGMWTTYKVERQWKGVTSDEITIYVPAICGGGFKFGDSVLITAERKDGRLVSTVTSHDFVMDSQRFVRMLGEGSPPPTPPSR
jgi:hypothetical protein